MGTGSTTVFHFTIQTKATAFGGEQIVQITFPTYYPDGLGYSIACKVGKFDRGYETTYCVIDDHNSRLLNVLGSAIYEFEALDPFEIII